MSWIAVQGIAFVVTFILSLVVCLFSATGSFGLISEKDHAKAIIYIFQTAVFSLFSVVIGVVYLFSAENYSQLTLLHLLYLPLAVIAYMTIKNQMYLTSEKRRNKNMVATDRKIKEWLNQFSFIHDRDCWKNVSAFKGEYGGSIYVTTLDENIHSLKEKENELPEKVKLKITVRSKEEQDWLDSVRNWIKKVSEIGEMTIEDSTFYNSDSTKHQGSIYIVCNSEYFSRIEELAKKLPTNIHLTLCEDKKIIHSLSSHIRHNQSYLDQHYKDKYLVFTTA